MNDIKKYTKLGVTKIRDGDILEKDDMTSVTKLTGDISKGIADPFVRSMNPKEYEEYLNLQDVATGGRDSDVQSTGDLGVTGRAFVPTQDFDVKDVTTPGYEIEQTDQGITRTFD